MATDSQFHRSEARRHFTEASDSYDRCDTDGALSQWAHDSLGHKALAEAELADNDGRHEFLALFTTDGELVDAKLRSGKYGMFWSLPNGDTLNHPKRQKTLVAKGYRVGLVSRPAGVDQHFSCVGAAPTTYHYPKGHIGDAVVVDDGSTWTSTDERPEVN